MGRAGLYGRCTLPPGDGFIKESESNLLAFTSLPLPSDRSPSRHPGNVPRQRDALRVDQQVLFDTGTPAIRGVLATPRDAAEGACEGAVDGGAGPGDLAGVLELVAFWTRFGTPARIVKKS